MPLRLSLVALAGSARQQRASCGPLSAIKKTIQLVVIGFLVVAPSLGYAVPSFARQTGMPCATCHAPFPQLTEFGRQFKVNGYTLSNGQTDYPPLAAMLQPSFTHTQREQPEAPGAEFNKNNNAALTQASVFYAGRLLGPYADNILAPTAAALANKIGIFLQATYDGVEHGWAWDEFELRFADAATLGKQNVSYGIYLNNNPTLQDPWNSTPAWSFPFSGSGLAPSPTAAPLLDGALAQQVIGIGTYAKFDNGLYIDIGGYRTLSARLQSRLGIDPADEMQLAAIAPYWRVAFEQQWGNHSWEIGTYGLAAHAYPERNNSAGKDRFIDASVDSQYQYLDGRNDITLRFNWLNEQQHREASQALGLADTHRTTLRDSKLSISYLYDRTYGFNAQYFRINGSRDNTLYADSRTGLPDSDGWIFQLDYLPFNKNGGPAFWPYSNIKFSLQYIWYRRFDGARENFDGDGRAARDNNTLYLEAWIAF